MGIELILFTIGILAVFTLIIIACLQPKPQTRSQILTKRTPNQPIFQSVPADAPNPIVHVTPRIPTNNWVTPFVYGDNLNTGIYTLKYAYGYVTIADVPELNSKGVYSIKMIDLNIIYYDDFILRMTDNTGSELIVFRGSPYICYSTGQRFNESDNTSTKSVLTNLGITISKQPYLNLISTRFNNWVIFGVLLPELPGTVNLCIPQATIVNVTDDNVTITFTYLGNPPVFVVPRTQSKWMYVDNKYNITFQDKPYTVITTASIVYEYISRDHTYTITPTYERIYYDPGAYRLYTISGTEPITIYNNYLIEEIPLPYGYDSIIADGFSDNNPYYQQFRLVDFFTFTPSSLCGLPILDNTTRIGKLVNSLLSVGSV